MRTLDGLLARIEILLTILAGAAVVAMTAAILFDVLSRLLFHQSVGWGTDLTEVLMYPLAFAAAALIARENGHVRVDVLTEHFSARFNRRVIAVTTLLSLLFVVCLFIGGWVSWFDHLDSGTATNSVFVPVFWFSIFMPVGAFFLVLEIFVQLARQIAAVVYERRDDHSVSAP